MSQRKANHDGKPGSIYRIALVNFVTFREVELYPGPNLNMIIGPNGTGKSTFVCAIVLGLCGKTSVIGRAKVIGEYVKSGHQDATIEIELFQQRGQPNVIITRNFNISNNSIWSINNKQVKMKQVQELIEGLDIRVDNLCQLLPQDRVQDFAKMNPQELLKSTQIAVSGQQAVDLLGQLIESKVEHRNVVASLNSSGKMLQEQEQINLRLQGVISSMNQLKKLEEQIAVCEKKRIWAEYEQLKLKLDDLIKDKNTSTELVKTHKERMAPLEKEIEDLMKNVTTLENGKLSFVRSISVSKREIKELLELHGVQNGKIEELESELNTKIQQHKSRNADIQQAKVTLAKMQSDSNNLIQLCGDENTVKQEMAALHKPISKANMDSDHLRNEKSHLQYELDSKLVPQQRLCENKLRSLGNIANKRLETLQAHRDHAYKAVMWLRDNKHLFSGNIYEPMMLELNFTEPRFARYLENTVSARDLVAFTFESSEDMNLFFRKTHSEMKLTLVNAVCSPPSREAFLPPVPIDHLRQLGFYTYLVDVISAPDAIVRYLCRLYNIHKIPIGNQDTYLKSQHVPNTINHFFSENHRFIIRVSKYSGAKSTSSFEIGQARLLANTLDQELLTTCQNQLSGYEAKAKEANKKIREFEDQLTLLDAKVNSLITKRKKLHETFEQLKTIQSRIRMQQNKVAALENEPSVDVEEEKRICQEDTVKLVLKQCKMQKRISEHFKDCQNKQLNGNMTAVKIDMTRAAILELKSELRQLKSNAQGAEQTLENINSQLVRIRSTAREKLQEAKKATGEFLPHEDGFPYSEEFARLPSELDAIQAYIEDLQSKIECMDGTDARVIKDYEDRDRLIKKLNQDVQKMTKESKKLEDRMINLRDQWLLPFERQIIEINDKFSGMFSQMGCAGEVCISKPGGSDDYDQYGISIMVRFREGEALQQLTQHTQSGGERALATALYLMALQQLARAPFRCVDEINQGMDPINERKMFQLLVKITTECDASSQYFLLTPKLLDKLEYSPSIKVHTVENGPRIVKYNKWSIDSFIENAPKYNM